MVSSLWLLVCFFFNLEREAQVEKKKGSKPRQQRNPFTTLLARASLRFFPIFMVKNSTYVLGVRHFLSVGWARAPQFGQRASACHSCQACTTIPRLLHKIKITAMQRQILSAFKVRPSTLRWEGTEAKGFHTGVYHPYFTFNWNRIFYLMHRKSFCSRFFSPLSLASSTTTTCVIASAVSFYLAPGRSSEEFR